MAFHREKFKDFRQGIKDIKTGNDAEMRWIAEDFILEERLADNREDNYGEYVTPPRNGYEWKGMHRKYVAEKIEHPPQRIPETFTNLNCINLLPQLDKNQYLVRLERIDSLIQIAKNTGYGTNVTLLKDSFKEYLEDRENSEAAVQIEEFFYKCNEARDSRPMFVGFLSDIEDILRVTDVQWANRLRDRFGLCHFDPKGKAPISVLLLCYQVKDVIDNSDAPNFAAPTILDGRLNHCFYPTPQKGFSEGFTLDLTSGTENEYTLNREILHRYIEYEPSYVYRMGEITESPGKSCEEARRIHFEFLRDDFRFADQL